jgi:hypothetical protein
MERKTEAKLNMYRAVANHCNANPAIVATVPAFQTAVTALNANISTILSTAQMEVQVISGITADKSALKESLAQQAADIAAIVFAFASSTNNNTLKEQVKFSFREILRIKDDLIAPTCLNIHDAANANLAALAAYGITAATLTAFNNAITNYSAAVPSPRNAVSLRAAYKKDITNLIKQTDKLLKEQLDKLSVQFKTANTEFYNAYKSNRVIIDAGAAGTQIKGKVVSAVDNKALKDVKVEIVGNGLSDLSSNTGRFMIKPGAAGNYSIKLSKTGFQDNTLANVVVQTGQPSDVGTVILTPAA